METIDIINELNENLHNGMSREEAYNLYDIRICEYKKTHKIVSDFNFLYPEMIITPKN